MGRGGGGAGLIEKRTGESGRLAQKRGERGLLPDKILSNSGLQS